MQRVCISIVMVLVSTIAVFADTPILKENENSNFLESQQLVAANTVLQTSQKNAQQPVIAGYVETASLVFCGTKTPVTLDAKLDTGADSSSLHATAIKLDKQKSLVTFTYTDNRGVSRRITCPYVRITRIKKRPSGVHERPVIRVKVQIGDKKFDASVNLTDRTNFKYKMLVGRKELRQGMFIDSSRKHRLTSPSPK